MDGTNWDGDTPSPAAVVGEEGKGSVAGQSGATIACTTRSQNCQQTIHKGSGSDGQEEGGADVEDGGSEVGSADL